MSVALPILELEPQRPVYANGPRDLASVKLLRISITDRCNLRCVYCMPDEGVPFTPKDDLLTADDIACVAAAARSVGIDHFKLTGGEPTIHPQVMEVAERLAALEPRDLSLTTNGLLLDELARPLRQAGVDRLTVSLDTLRSDRFDAITGGRMPGGLDRVRAGIDAAERAGFERIKINCVVIAGMNDDEVVDMARLTLKRDWTVRFIEYMPLGESVLTRAAMGQVDNKIVASRIETELGALQRIDRQSEAGVGPASVFRLPGARGRIGFISAMSQPFCETCNRLRLTATGELRSCLFDGGEINIMSAVRPRADIAGLIDMMSQCVQMKPEVHSHHGNRAMSQMGG